MTQYQKILSPESIALIGASDRPESVGYAVIKNMENPNFKGKMYLINARKAELMGQKTYPDVKSCPEKIDLAVICIPAKAVPKVVEECGLAGVAGLVIISAGFAEAGEEGIKMCEEINGYCNKYNMRMIGPNCLGIINPSAGVNATFAGITPEAGHVAFVSQSGALCTAVLDWAQQQRVGFRYFISVGSTVNTDYADLFEYFETDPEVNCIILYSESIKDSERFQKCARQFAKTRPIFILKAGKSEEGAQAAMSHTGSLAGNDAVYDKVFENCGIIRVESINDLWDIAHTMATQKLPDSNRLCIVTNAGGPGVISTDCLVANGAQLSKLSEATMEKLNKTLSVYWSHGNPVDVLGDATPKIYQQTVDICVEDENIDGVIVILTPQAMTDPLMCAKEIVSKKYAKPVLTSWMGEHLVKDGINELEKGGIPNFDTPERAIKAFCNIMKHSEIKKRLSETVEKVDLPKPDVEGARKIYDEVVKDGRTAFDEYEGKLFFSKYNIPISKFSRAKTRDEAKKEAAACGFPVVMKICSPDIMHKTDIGGVKLSIKTEDEAAAAFDEIMENAKKNAPKAKLHGVFIEKMSRIKSELIIGMKKDPLFGPVIVFGSGGITVELYKDSNIGIPPLNANDADRLIDGTKISKVLRGFRGMKGYDVEQLKKLLMQFSQMVMDFPTLSEVDINPLAGNEEGFIVLDSKIVLKL